MRAIIFLIIVISLSSQAQIQSLDLNSAGIGSNGAIRYFNPTLTGADKSKMNYSEIRGRYLWDEEWRPARVTLKKGQEFYIPQVRLNLYSKEIHYRNTKGEELVAGNGIIKSIRFYDASDSTREVALFESYITQDGESFFEVLSKGKLQFLKRVISHLHKGNYDAMMGKYDYRFVTNTDYFVKDEEKITGLKNLNKESLASVVSFSKELEDWLVSNKNKLKKEADFISFFNYYNQQK